MRHPDITILIPTYARVFYLNEALWCCLQQTVPCRVLVLNDCEAQRLVSNHPDISIINTKPYPYLGDKRNAMLDMVTTKYACWVDDDDWLLPDYVEGLWHMKQNDDIHNMTQFERILSAYGGNDGRKDLAWGTCSPVMQSLVVTEDARGKFPSIDCGEDQVFRDRMKCRRDNTTLGGYVYRWANGTHHTSGNGQPDSGKGVRSEAYSRLARGSEPSGEILIHPNLDLSWLSTMPADIKIRTGWAIPPLSV